jgi:hypothetical protein
MSKTLTTLKKEVKALAKYAEKQMPREVSKLWLWTSQNAFLTSKDPSTGKEWADRFGRAFGKGFTKPGTSNSISTTRSCTEQDDFFVV